MLGATARCDALAAALAAQPGVDRLTYRGDALLPEPAQKVDAALIDLASLLDPVWQSIVAEMGDDVPLIAVAAKDELQPPGLSARAIAPHDCTPAELTALIRRAVRGDLACTSGLAATLQVRLRETGQGGVPVLTEREAEILDLSRQGISPREISLTLSLSVASVENHLRNIRSRLA